MRTVIETPTYWRSIEGIWSDDEAAEFVSFISARPEAGDVVRGTKGLRKGALGAFRQGQRGGARVFYLWRNARAEVLLVIAYTKAKFDNLSAEFFNRLMEQYDA
jgi:hypothetical protein